MPVAGCIGVRPPVFSRDARFVFVTSSNSVRAYAVATGVHTLSFSGHTAPVTGIAEHPSLSRQIVTSSLDGTLRLWDVDDAACLRVVRIGAPITHLCAPALLPDSRSAAMIYVAVALHHGEESEGYPLGNEVACLRPRPLATSFAFTVAGVGHSRAAPKSAVFEVDLSAGVATRRLGGHDGFVVGLEGRCNESAGGVVDRTLVYALRRRLYVWRSSPTGEVLALYRHSDRLSTCSLHPRDAYAVTGDVQGRIRTWFLPELAPDFVAPLALPLLNAATSAAALADESHEQLEDVKTCPESSAELSEQLNTLISLPRVAARAGQPDVPTSTAHWHSHAVWCTAFAPNGAFLLSGGEEAVVVVWQLLPSGGGVASAASGNGSRTLSAVGKGPVKSPDAMTFFARVGAPIRCLAAYAAPDAASSTDSARETLGSHVRTAPPLMFSFTCVDNSFSAINALTLRELWRVRGLSVCGLAAVPPVGVINSLSRYAHRNATKRGLVLSRSGKHFELAGDRGTLLHATTRFLRRGVVVDPRTRSIVLNGLPGRSTLQWYDTRKDLHVMEVEDAAYSIYRPSLIHFAVKLLRGLGWVCFGRDDWNKLNRCYESAMDAAYSDIPPQSDSVAPRNLVSRIDADPPPPVRVTHAAFSSDGNAMATLDVSDGIQTTSEVITLRFWSWSGQEERYVLNTRVQMPHKADVRCLEFHPSLLLVATGSRDRTFKLWDRLEAAPVVSLAHDQHKLRRKLQQQQSGDAPGDLDTVAVSAAADAAVESGKQRVSANRKARCTTNKEAVTESATSIDQSAQTTPRFVWQCRSVGFYRDFPCSAAAFSGDGTALALGYGHHVTLWDWRDNALKSILVQRSAKDAGMLPGDELQRTVHLSGSLRHGSTATTFARADDDDATRARARESDDDVKHLAFAGLSALLVSASAHTVHCWNVLSCALVWSFSASVLSLAADRIGLATSPRVVLVVHDKDRLRGAASDSGRSSAFVRAQPQGRVHVVLLDAESHIPLGSWILPHSYVGSQVEINALPAEARVPLYAAAFVAAAGDALAAPVGVLRTHDVLVLGPQNELWRLPTAGLVSAVAIPAGPGPVSVADTPGARQPTPLQQAAGVAPPRAFMPVGERLTRTGVLTVAAGRGSAEGIPFVANAKASMTNAGAASSGGGVSALLRSAGTVQALSSPSYLYEALLDSLLPPSLPVTSESRKTAHDAETAAGLAVSRAAGCKRARSSTGCADSDPVAAALRGAGAWGFGDFPDNLSGTALQAGVTCNEASGFSSASHPMLAPVSSATQVASSRSVEPLGSATSASSVAPAVLESRLSSATARTMASLFGQFSRVTEPTAAPPASSGTLGCSVQGRTGADAPMSKAIQPSGPGKSSRKSNASGAEKSGAVSAAVVPPATDAVKGSDPRVSQSSRAQGAAPPSDPFSSSTLTPLVRPTPPPSPASVDSVQISAGGSRKTRSRSRAESLSHALREEGGSSSVSEAEIDLPAGLPLSSRRKQQHLASIAEEEDSLAQEGSLAPGAAGGLPPVPKKAAKRARAQH